MFKIKLRKLRSTWHWFVENPVGGGFGSNDVASKKFVIRKATQNIPIGAPYQVFRDGTLEGEFVK